MIETTKAIYLSMPRSQRRRHKDGTYWLLMRQPGSKTTWVQVTWKQ